jgi:hypothetical protein
MTKQEKLDIKLLMTEIKDSLFPEKWDNVVQEFPFVLQDDEDIDDDAITSDVVVVSGDPVARGKESIKRKSQLAQNNEDLSAFTRDVQIAYGVTFALIHGVAQDYEEAVGFYIHSKQVLYRPYSSCEGAISFASNKDEVAYLRTLGYVPLNEIKDIDSSN